MDLTIQGSALAFFWGTCLANFLWVNKHSLIRNTKNYASNIASYVWTKSKKIVKRYKAQSKPIEQNENSVETEASLIQNEPNADLDNGVNLQVNQKALEMSSVSYKKQKKQKKRAKKPRNLRKYTKNYQQWLLSNPKPKNVENQPNEFREHLQKIESRKLSEDIRLSKTKLPENEEEFQQYVQDQLDIEEDQYACLVPYDPFISDQQQANLKTY